MKSSKLFIYSILRDSRPLQNASFHRVIIEIKEMTDTTSYHLGQSSVYKVISLDVRSS